METTMAHASPTLARSSARGPFALLAALFLLTGLAARGQGAPAPPSPTGTPRFFLETITVENTSSVSPEIVISESRLSQGVAYSEDQLRDAVHRITRLPFILDADFRLEKGSARDSYELVISVYETRKWFFGLDVVYTHEDDPGLSSEADDVELTRSLAGRRFSIGKYGVLFAAFDTDDSILSVGYTQYNLAGRGILLDLSYAFESWSSNSDAHRLDARVVVPVRTNQSLRFGASYVLERDRTDPFVFEGRFEDFGDLTGWVTEAAWTYNSLDDPVFPTTGLLAEGGLRYSRLSQDFFLRSLEEGDVVVERRGETSSESSSLRLQARRYWPVSPRNSLFAGIDTSFTNTDSSNPLNDLPRREVDLWRNTVTVGHGMFLLSQRRKDAWRELRWETEVQATFRDRSPDTGSDFTSGVVSTGLAYRNGWGVFRLVAQYVDFAI
jgi:hypothetical protein